MDLLRGVPAKASSAGGSAPPVTDTRGCWPKARCLKDHANAEKMACNEHHPWHPQSQLSFFLKIHRQYFEPDRTELIVKVISDAFLLV
eukprot:2122971-Amphidinium_carterae.1